MNISKKIFICTLASIGSVFTLNAENSLKNTVAAIDKRLEEFHSKIYTEFSDLATYLLNEKMHFEQQQGNAGKKVFETLGNIKGEYERIQHELAEMGGKNSSSLKKLLK